MFCYVWSYIARPESLQVFRSAYGPDGDWAQLFRRDDAYIGTHLLAGHENPTQFMTIDFWTSRQAFMSFRERFSREFETIDKTMEGLTTLETHVGDFDVLDEMRPPSGGQIQSR